MNKPSAIVTVSLLLAACSAAAPEPAGPGAELRQLTGAHTRIVWVQGDGTDPSAEGEHLVLMGFDTDDGRGERAIRNVRQSYVAPLLTSRGDRIVFSTRPVPGPPEVFVLNWDGTGLRKLADGLALDLWTDSDGFDWLYLGTDNTEYNFATVTRFPLDSPDRRELVWNKTLVSMDTFRVSPDGRYAGGMWPWPEAGVAELPNGSVTKLGQGCWTSMFSARGPLFWYLDGPHRNLTFVDVHTQVRWVVNINDPDGFAGAEVNHPRWSNHPRFIAMSGPYNQGGPNQARTGGKQVEVYVGRFREDFSDVEAWTRVTSNAGGDSYPEMWIDLEASPYPQRVGGRLGPPNAAARGATAEADGDAGRIVLNVRLIRPSSIPEPQAILPYRHAMVVNEYEVLDLLEGAHAEKTIQIAQWAIRDSRVIPEARRHAGAGFTLTVERYDAHPELEGERVVADGDVAISHLYYDVTP
jgi:hypothetical protein